MKFKEISFAANIANYPIGTIFSADGTGFTGDTVTLTGSGTSKGVMANISGYAPTSSGAFSFTGNFKFK